LVQVRENVFDSDTDEQLLIPLTSLYDQRSKLFDLRGRILIGGGKRGRRRQPS